VIRSRRRPTEDTGRASLQLGSRKMTHQWKLAPPPPAPSLQCWSGGSWTLFFWFSFRRALNISFCCCSSFRDVSQPISCSVSQNHDSQARQRGGRGGGGVTGCTESNSSRTGLKLYMGNTRKNYLHIFGKEKMSFPS